MEDVLVSKTYSNNIPEMYSTDR